MKTNRLGLLAALSFALAGCSEMLTETPKNFLTTESYYQTPADIEAATLSAYQPLTRDEVWRRWLLWDAELASDQVRIHPDEPNFGTYHPGLFMWTPVDGSVVNPWNGIYTTIYRANLVLEKIGGVAFTDATRQKQLVAEAKFLRAYGYLLLTKLYDDVPLHLKTEDHAKSASATRAPVEQVHTQIVKDLTDAETDLPDAPLAIGRANKAAAQMVLADLYQWRASFLKKAEWDKLSTTAKKVLDNSRWGLMDDYLAPFLPANKGNKEIIWAVISSGVDGRSSFDNFCNYLPRALGFGTAGGCEVIGQPTRWQYNNYLCTSPDTIQLNSAGRLSDTTRIANCDYRKRVTYRSGGCSTNSTIGCVVFKWPNINKYRPTNRGVGGPIDTDHPLYRYAETILMYAEAQNELGNTAVAVQQINLLRARARKGGTDGPAGSEPHDYGTKGEPVDRASVREAIYEERGWELAHEAKRWFDQIRHDGKDAPDKDYWYRTTAEHDPETVVRGDMRPFRKRFPIPAREISLAPALTQNPGY